MACVASSAALSASSFCRPTSFTITSRTKAGISCVAPCVVVDGDCMGREARGANRYRVVWTDQLLRGRHRANLVAALAALVGLVLRNPRRGADRTAEVWLHPRHAITRIRARAGRDALECAKAELQRHGPRCHVVLLARRSLRCSRLRRGQDALAELRVRIVAMCWGGVHGRWGETG